MLTVLFAIATINPSNSALSYSFPFSFLPIFPTTPFLAVPLPDKLTAKPLQHRLYTASFTAYSPAQEPTTAR